MSETPTIPPYINSAMKFSLRSPLHGMVSKSVLLIPRLPKRMLL